MGFWAMFIFQLDNTKSRIAVMGVQAYTESHEH